MCSKTILFAAATLFLFLIGTEGYAQQPVQPQKISPEQESHLKNLRDRWVNAIGTFQIQIVNSRINPQVDVAVIEQIETARKENEVVYLPLREHVRIMILPTSAIQKEGSEKLELYKYVQE